MVAPMITEIDRPREKAIGGALEGASTMERETARWLPNMGSADQIINTGKTLADARSQDMGMNDGYAAGAVAMTKDSIVGNQFRLNAKPNWRALGMSPTYGPEWAEDFQGVVESRFNLIADSEACWLDASRRNTLTGMVRLAIGGWCYSGEVLSTAEWIKDDPRRPLKTAVQMISPARLSNANGLPDSPTLRAGVEMDRYGRPVSYHIRNAYPTEVFDPNSYMWRVVPSETKWGRRQVLHVMEQSLTAQSRGISAMVAVLKQMRMTKKFHEVTLQNAVINASFAAVIESEMPSPDVFAQLGAGNGTDPLQAWQRYMGAYMGDLGRFLDASKTINLDGAKIPHLYPGGKLNLKPAGDPGGIGGDFEQALLRHIAAALGLSYEQFSRDYTQTNYSSARASMNETWKAMMAKKKAIADRFASQIYALVLEEEIAAGNVPLPRGKDRKWFYQPLVKDALVECEWIGAARGQIDETKETQAAIMRINAGLSTWEKEISNLGGDWRAVFEQKAREVRMMKALGLDVDLSAAKPTANNTAPASKQGDQEDDEL